MAGYEGDNRRKVRRIDIAVRIASGLLALGVIGFGWYARDYIANNLAAADDVTRLQTQVTYLLDSQNDWLVGQIAYLERKDGKNADDRERLDRFRQRLATLRVIRNGNGQ